MKSYIFSLVIILFSFASFTSNAQIDDALLGKWQLKEQILITTLADSSKKEEKTEVFNGAVKEYKEDGSFQVANSAGVYISGVYNCANGQILEHVKSSVIEKLNGSRNTLSYRLVRQDRDLIITFQLPGMTDQKYQEIWKRK